MDPSQIINRFLKNVEIFLNFDGDSLSVNFSMGGFVRHPAAEPLRIHFVFSRKRIVRYYQKSVENRSCSSTTWRLYFWTADVELLEYKRK